MSLILDGTNGLSDVDGSAATPAIRGSDANTGVFFGSDVVGLSTGGTERMRVDASGNVGIGTSSPSAKLYVSGAAVSGVGQIAVNSDTVAQITLRQNDVLQAQFFSTGTSAVLGTSTATPLVLRTDNTERARIDSSGNLLVGKTNAAEANVGVVLNAAGDTYFTRSGSTDSNSTLHVYSTGASAFRFYVGMGGTVFATNTTISAISDQRLKENVEDIDVGLDAVMALKPRKFDWKEGKGKNVKGDRGWIAQEFEQVFPDMIDEWKDPSPEGEEPYKSVRADLIPVLVKAIQEQQAIITALTARVEALEGAQA
jgi:hypothetical protein